MSVARRVESPPSMPARAGVGLKAEHCRLILETRPDVGFFEVHAENYMGAGGPPHRHLTAIAEHYPLSIHGVGLSIGGEQPLDREHLTRLRDLVRRYRPALVSEHLAWSTHGTSFLADLLPTPYTRQTLLRVAEHIDQVQQVLGRRMLLENPSTYLAFSQSTCRETDFIAEVASRTRCGLLLDVNNVRVSSVNQVWDPFAYLATFPLEHVRQFHLAGHARDVDAKGRPLLIDTHDREVDDEVWTLFEFALARTGPAPALIEWDAKVPAWPVLAAEAERAEAMMRRASPGRERRASGR